MKVTKVVICISKFID